MAGRPPDVSDEELLAVLAESPDPAVFTGEVADELSIGRDGVRKRLDELVGRGLVEKKQRGNSIIWWTPTDGQRFLAGETDDDLDADDW